MYRDVEMCGWEVVRPFWGEFCTVDIESFKTNIKAASQFDVNS